MPGQLWVSTVTPVKRLDLDERVSPGVGDGVFTGGSGTVGSSSDSGLGSGAVPGEQATHRAQGAASNARSRMGHGK